MNILNMILAEPGRTQWDLKWRMFGIPVRIHPFFWLMALLVSYHELIPFGYVLLIVAAVFLSILVHEFGHALSSRHYGSRSESVVLYSFGGLCIHDEQPARHWPKIWILFWGPGAGFILGGIAYGLQWYLHPYGWAGILLYALVWFNLVWGAINLLVPVFPLDSGQIMREIVLWKAPRQGDLLAFRISFYSAIIAALAALAYAFFQKPRDSRNLFPFFLFASLAYSSYQIIKQLKQGYSFGGEEERREAWQQDPDWWKKG